MEQSARTGQIKIYGHLYQDQLAIIDAIYFSDSTALNP